MGGEGETMGWVRSKWKLGGGQKQCERETGRECEALVYCTH